MLIFKPLARRSIALVWMSQLLTTTGSELYMVAVVWVATSMVGREAGYVSALQSAALLAGSLFGGILTDRWRFGATMVAMNLLRAVLLLLLAAAGQFDFMSLPLLALAAGLIALATAAFEPALQAVLPTLAPDPAWRHATNGLFDATRRMARILGPSLIAFASAAVSTVHFFAITAVSFLLATGCLLAGLHQVDLPRQARAPAGIAGLVDALTGGVRALRGHPVMVFGLLGSLTGNVAWAMGVLLGMMLHLRETSDDPLIQYSLMMSAYGVGNLAANLVLSNRQPRQPVVWLIASKLLFGAGVALMPAADSQIVLMLVAGFAALNGPFENLALLHIMQTDFPPHRLAQVFRLQMASVFGGALLAYLAAPSLFGHLGVETTIVAAGLLTLTIGLSGLPLALRANAAGQT